VLTNNEAQVLVCIDLHTEFINLPPCRIGQRATSQATMGFVRPAVALSIFLRPI